MATKRNNNSHHVFCLVFKVVSPVSESVPERCTAGWVDFPLLTDPPTHSTADSMTNSMTDPSKPIQMRGCSFALQEIRARFRFFFTQISREGLRAHTRILSLPRAAEGPSKLSFFVRLGLLRCLYLSRP